MEKNNGYEKQSKREKRRRSAMSVATSQENVDHRSNLPIWSTGSLESPSKLKLKFVVQSEKNERKSAPNVAVPSPSTLKLKFTLPKKLTADDNFETLQAPTTPKANYVDNNPLSSNDVENVSEKKKSSRISEFITDRSSRVRSYFRRRHAPFRRTFDLDLQCGTRSLLVQVCADIEECLYFGDDSLVNKFLSDDGIGLHHVEALLAEAKHGRKSIEEVDEVLSSNNRRRSERPAPNVMAGDNSDDDDYLPTVKEKEKLEKERRREMQQKLTDGEFLANINDRSRVFKARKESLFGKIKETDGVCGTKSFLLILNVDQDAAYYHGDQSLATYFFSSGLSSKNFGKVYNVRAFEIDEVDQNKCSVSHCLVTRNLLSRWRHAAIDLFNFPVELPMTLYLCPEAEKERWISELKLDASSSGKIYVCSLHFKDGLPTSEFPYPTLFLDPKVPDVSTFSGSKKSDTVEETLGDETKCDTDANVPSDIPGTALSIVETSKAFKKFSPRVKDPMMGVSKRAKHRQALASLRKRRKWIPASIIGDKKSEELHRRSLTVTSMFGSRICCRFCSAKFVGTRNYVDHIRQVHLVTTDKSAMADKGVDGGQSEDASVTADKIDAPAEESVTHPKKFKRDPIHFDPEEMNSYLEALYPYGSTKVMNPLKKYVCASCKLKFDLYGLFSHMKKTHGGLLCQYCLKLFKKVSEMELHFRAIHRVPKWYFHSSRLFTNYAGINYDFICSLCNEVVSKKAIEQHKCNKVAGQRIFECPACDRTFPHQKTLEMHISNGWCKAGKHRKGVVGYERITDESECAKRFRVLTGKDPNFLMIQPPKVKPAVGPSSSSVTTEKPKKPPSVFNVSDRQIMIKYTGSGSSCSAIAKLETEEKPVTVLADLPETGSIFCGRKARGVTSDVRREMKESGQSWQVSGRQLFRAGSNFFLDPRLHQRHLDHRRSSQTASDDGNWSDDDMSKSMDDHHDNYDDTMEDNNSHVLPDVSMTDLSITSATVDTAPSASKSKTKKSKKPNLSIKISLPQKKESKAERVARQQIEITQCLEKLRHLVDFFGISSTSASEPSCLFCQQSHFVTLDAIFLLSHLIVVHDRAQVEQRLGENAEDAILRLRTHLRDTRKDEIMFRYGCDPSQLGLTYNCCYCSTHGHIDDYEKLFAHLLEEHNSKVLNCHLCKNIFLNYGSFVSHVCFGPLQQPIGGVKPRAKFVCPACDRDNLVTFLEFQFHVRKHHNVCEICLKSCDSQESLSSHCLKHSQELMCMKCFLTFDDLSQFRKHLFYKHETDHSTCATCHMKTWTHVYHFCIVMSEATCEVCDKHFDSLGQYRVHLRTHTGANPYVCFTRNCQKSYISKQLLLKHQLRRHPENRVSATKALEDRRNQRLMRKFGAKSLDSIRLAETWLDDLIRTVVETSERLIMSPTPSVASQSIADEMTLIADRSVASEKPETYEDPIDAAVRSIMGPDGSFDLHMSPTKALSTIIPPNAHDISEKENKSPEVSLPEAPKREEPVISLAPSSTIVAPLDDLEDDGPPLLVVRIPPPKEPVMKMQKAAAPAPSSSSSESSEDEAKTNHKSPALTNGHSEASPTAVIGGIWNQDLFFLGGGGAQPSSDAHQPPKKKGCKVMKPKYQTSGSPNVSGIRALPAVSSNDTFPASSSISKTLGTGGWDVLLSESSDSDQETNTPKARIIERTLIDKRISIKDHDYCHDAFLLSQRPPTPPPSVLKTPATLVRKQTANTMAAKASALPAEDLSEMDKIADNVAFGSFDLDGKKKHKRRKDGKKKKKKRKKSKRNSRESSSSDSEDDLNGFPRHLAESTPATFAAARKGPKPKYHTSMTSRGVTAGTARPRFSSSENEDVSSEDNLSNVELASSDLDTDFSADERTTANNTGDLSNAVATTSSKRMAKLTPKVAALREAERRQSADTSEPSTPQSATLKLKIRLPMSAPPGSALSALQKKSAKLKRETKKRKKLKQSGTKSSKSKKTDHYGFGDYFGSSGKANKSAEYSSTSDEDLSDTEQSLVVDERLPPLDTSIATADGKLYCICQCPHDDVSEMIACDAPDCQFEWYHFECVGIMVPPKGRWYCQSCRERYHIKDPAPPEYF